MKNVLKEKILFFVLLVQKKKNVFKKRIKLFIQHLQHTEPAIQFFVSRTKFSVLVQSPVISNSTYPTLNSL